ncbi:MAG: hypothetical protein QY327_11735 [Fimbriimonadaceae bacterium]|nr:MAG: hypothetical protein QY327_11735 [Fimbriimonadaceae bacterium]
MSNQQDGDEPGRPAKIGRTSRLCNEGALPRRNLMRFRLFSKNRKEDVPPSEPRAFGEIEQELFVLQEVIPELNAALANHPNNKKLLALREQLFFKLEGLREELHALRGGKSVREAMLELGHQLYPEMAWEAVLSLARSHSKGKLTEIQLSELRRIHVDYEAALLKFLLIDEDDDEERGKAAAELFLAECKVRAEAVHRSLPEISRDKELTKNRLAEILGKGDAEHDPTQ